MLLDLPDLPQREIFNFLTIPVWLRARRVCKGWKLVIDTLHLPQRLCIYSTSYPKGDEWLDCNRKKVTDNELAHLKINFEHNCFRMNFFLNIQCLYLYEIGDRKLDLFLEQINQLTRLRVLMIYGREISGPKKLSSTNLESLSIKCLDSDARPELDAPNLRSLVIWNDCEWFHNAWCFRFPLTIKRLECNFFNPHLSQLKSVETIVCLQFVWMNFKLENFKFLKRLEIWPRDEEQLEEVRQIQREREASKRPVKLIICGFEELLITCERDETNRVLELSPDYLEQIASNRSKFVGYAPWPVKLEAGVFQQFADRVPIELLTQHFPNISYIGVKPGSFPQESPVSTSGLIELLRRTGPQELRIEMNLARQFYEQFATLNSIKSLTVRAQFFAYEIAMENEHYEPFEFQHFDCLLELKNLESICMDCPKISTDFMCKLVKMPFLSNFEFRNYSAFSISISFYENRHLTEAQWPGGPFFFGLYYNFNILRPSGFRKWVGEDELIVEIKRTEEDELIKPYLL